MHYEAFCMMSLQPCLLADGAIAKISSSLAGAKGGDGVGENEETQQSRAERVDPGARSLPPTRYNKYSDSKLQGRLWTVLTKVDVVAPSSEARFLLIGP